MSFWCPINFGLQRILGGSRGQGGGKAISWLLLSHAQVTTHGSLQTSECGGHSHYLVYNFDQKCLRCLISSGKRGATNHHGTRNDPVRDQCKEKVLERSSRSIAGKQEQGFSPLVYIWREKINVCLYFARHNVRANYDLKKHIRGLGHFIQPAEANHSIESIVESLSMLPKNLNVASASQKRRELWFFLWPHLPV